MFQLRCVNIKTLIKNGSIKYAIPFQNFATIFFYHSFLGY